MTDRLFTSTELSDWTQSEISSGTALLRERVVWGWLKPVLGLDKRPDAVSEELFAWAIELGGIAHENPSGKSSYQLGEEQTQYSAERRQEILDEAAGSVGGDTSKNGLSVSSFPEAQPYPDPARDPMHLGHWTSW